MIESPSKNLEKRTPKLISPIRSFEGVVRVINAGADKVYCGVRMPEMGHFVLYRGSYAEIPTYDELGRVVKYAHDHGVEVLLTVNNPFMADIMDGVTRRHIRLCVDRGVDGLIIGDLGILSLVRDMGVDVQLYASTYFTSMNYEAVNFLGNLGFDHAILERHMTIGEISEIVQRSKIGVEVFVHGAGCSNINGKCYLFHFHYPALDRSVKGFCNPCNLPFEVYDVNDKEKMLENIPAMDALTGCSLCLLPDLIGTGVEGFKIVGRDAPTALQENITRLYRELIDLITCGQIEAFWERVESTKRTFMAVPPSIFTLQERLCEEKRCYYSPLFHTPYRIPLSLSAWTKLQFSSIMVEE